MSNFQEIQQISGAYLLKNFYMEDLRGNFLKVHRFSQLPAEIAALDFRETFATSSRKNVIRGMHFQLPPYDISKLITVISGQVLDVVFDMRRSSPTFGNCFSILLGEKSSLRSIFVPSGCAHGFLALEDRSLMLYQSTCEFVPDHDSGIRFDSIGFAWPADPENIILSDKDRELPPWDPQNTPFV